MAGFEVGSWRSTAALTFVNPTENMKKYFCKIWFQGSTKRNKRQAPMNELVDTEDKYLENLIMVRDKFRDKLTLISNLDKAIIFYKLVSTSLQL